MRTDWSPASCRPRNQPKSTARTGQDLPATGGLIQKIYELDPLTCPKCQGKMRITAFIEDPEIVKKIIKHLALWAQKARPPPKANAPPMAPECHFDYTDSQVPVSDDSLCVDPEYPETFPS